MKQKLFFFLLLESLFFYVYAMGDDGSFYTESSTYGKVVTGKVNVPPPGPEYSSDGGFEESQTTPPSSYPDSKEEDPASLESPGVSEYLAPESGSEEFYGFEKQEEKHCKCFLKRKEIERLKKRINNKKQEIEDKNQEIKEKNKKIKDKNQEIKNLKNKTVSFSEYEETKKYLEKINLDNILLVHAFYHISDQLKKTQEENKKLKDLLNKENELIVKIPEKLVNKGLSKNSKKIRK